MNNPLNPMPSASPVDERPRNRAGSLPPPSVLRETPSNSDPPAPEANVEALRRLLNGLQDSGAAFQSVAVVAVQTIEHALCFEREATKAALSLGQQQKMQAMVATASEASQLLRDALQAQGARVMHLCACPPETKARSGQSWWNAVQDALRVLEEGNGRMASLTTAQPKGSPAYTLCHLTAQLLRDHHDALVLEAEGWIG